MYVFSPLELRNFREKKPFDNILFSAILGIKKIFYYPPSNKNVMLRLLSMMDEVKIS